MEGIELKDFIRDALVQIASGINEANQAVRAERQNRAGAFMLRANIGDAAKIPGVAFDIAVTATKNQRDKAGFMVALASIGGGAATEKGFGGEATHRIKFEVGIERQFA